jgi:hypothetical protein
MDKLKYVSIRKFIKNEYPIARAMGIDGKVKHAKLILEAFKELFIKPEKVDDKGLTFIYEVIRRQYLKIFDRFNTSADFKLLNGSGEVIKEANTFKNRIIWNTKGNLLLTKPADEQTVNQWETILKETDSRILAAVSESFIDFNVTPADIITRIELERPKLLAMLEQSEATSMLNSSAETDLQKQPAPQTQTVSQDQKPQSQKPAVKSSEQLRVCFLHQPDGPMGAITAFKEKVYSVLNVAGTAVGKESEDLLKKAAGMLDITVVKEDKFYREKIKNIHTYDCVLYFVHEPFTGEGKKIIEAVEKKNKNMMIIHVEDMYTNYVKKIQDPQLKFETMLERIEKKPKTTYSVKCAEYVGNKCQKFTESTTVEEAMIDIMKKVYKKKMSMSTSTKAMYALLLVAATGLVACGLNFGASGCINVLQKSASSVINSLFSGTAFGYVKAAGNYLWSSLLAPIASVASTVVSTAASTMASIGKYLLNPLAAIPFLLRMLGFTRLAALPSTAMMTITNFIAGNPLLRGILTHRVANMVRIHPIGSRADITKSVIINILLFVIGGPTAVMVNVTQSAVLALLKKIPIIKEEKSVIGRTIELSVSALAGTMMFPSSIVTGFVGFIFTLPLIYMEASGNGFSSILKDMVSQNMEQSIASTVMGRQST